MVILLFFVGYLTGALVFIYVCTRYNLFCWFFHDNTELFVGSFFWPFSAVLCLIILVFDWVIDLANKHRYTQ